MISIIAALGCNNVIGTNNSLPWSLPADLRHFKILTKNKPIIMGSKTFESIGMALPQRDNIVLTRDAKYTAPGCKIATSIEHAVSLAKQSEMGDEIMICGGASVYKQFLPMTDRMYLTFIDNDFEGDTYFPEFDKTEWRALERKDHKADEKNLYDYFFLILEKI